MIFLLRCVKRFTRPFLLFNLNCILRWTYSIRIASDGAIFISESDQRGNSPETRNDPQRKIYRTYPRIWNGLYQGLVNVMWLICNTIQWPTSLLFKKIHPNRGFEMMMQSLSLSPESTSWSSRIHKPIVPTATDHFVYYGQRKLELDLKK